MPEETPIAVELMKSRRTVTGDSGSHEKMYTVTGSADEEEIIAAVEDAIDTGSGNDGSTYDTLVLKSIEVEPEYIDENNPDKSRWNATVTYGPAKSGGSPGNPADATFQFETGGGTRHITQSLQTMQAVGGPEGSGGGSGGGVAPDFHQAIGVERDESGNTRHNGCDIYVPQFRFSETHNFTDDQVTEAFKIQLADLTCTVNDDIFHGFEIGEVLFLGASGQRAGDDVNDLWNITYNFAVSRNKTEVVVSDEITLVDVGGWEYVWVIYGQAEDEDSKTTIRKPTAAYAERVYEYGDFGLLNIGTGS